MGVTDCSSGLSAAVNRILRMPSLSNNSHAHVFYELQKALQAQTFPEKSLSDLNSLVTAYEKGSAEEQLTLSEKIRDITIQETDILGSIILIGINNLGGTTQRHCQLGSNHGRLDLETDQTLSESRIMFETEGLPAGAFTRDAYFQRLKTLSEKQETLEPKFLSDLLNDPAFNKMSNSFITVRNERVYLPAQFEIDSHRFGTFMIDSLPFKVHTPFQIFQQIVQSCQLDATMGFHLAKLLNQGCLGRPCEILMRTMMNPLLGIYLSSAIITEVGYRTQHPDQAISSSFVEIELSAVFGAWEMDSQEEDCKKYLGYVKAVRKILLPKAQLKGGSASGGELRDTYSPFYSTVEEAVNFTVSTMLPLEPEPRTDGGGSGLCCIS